MSKISNRGIYDCIYLCTNKDKNKSTKISIHTLQTHFTDIKQWLINLTSIGQEKKRKLNSCACIQCKMYQTVLMAGEIQQLLHQSLNIQTHIQIPGEQRVCILNVSLLHNFKCLPRSTSSMVVSSPNTFKDWYVPQTWCVKCMSFDQHRASHRGRSGNRPQIVIRSL